MMELFETLEKLSLLCGTSGDESTVRDFIVSELPDGAKKRVDPIGNLIVELKGAKTPKNKLMLCAHMDEVGFIVTYITGGGMLKFATVGGIIPGVIFGRQVRFQNGAVGVIAGKPIHLLKDSEKDAQPKPDELYIDIGARSREEAKKLVRAGDCAYFASEFFRFGSGMIKGKALDDRVGCAVMLELMKKPLPYDCTFVFTVQEEVGARGAQAAAYSVKPDVAVVLETTTACDIAGVEEEKQVCRLGEGVVVVFMDKGTIYDREIFRLAFDTAAENGIAHQTKTVVAGGNDSGAIHKAAGGIRTTALSLPCRYLHSPACVISEKDLAATLRLAEKMIEKLGAL